MSLAVIIFRIHRWFLLQIRMLLCQRVVWKKSFFLYFSQVGYSRWRLKSLKNWTASWMNLHMRSLSSHLKNKLDSTVIPIKDIQTGLLTPCVRQLFVFILLLKCWYYILNLIPFCPLRNFAYSLELYLILHFFFLNILLWPNFNKCKCPDEACWCQYKKSRVAWWAEHMFMAFCNLHLCPQLKIIEIAEASWLMINKTVYRIADLKNFAH